jgi:hypothetical protein
MRLTSYNIAVTALKAECCLASYVSRMWGYIEEGDDEKTECAYEKAMQLSFLIDTLKRWKPTILSGKRLRVSATIASGTFLIPFFSSGTFIDGIRTTNPFQSESGDNSGVLSKLINSAICYISTDSDIVLSEDASSSSDSIEFTLMLSNEVDETKLEADWLGGVTWNVDFDLTENVTNTYYCLTDEEILSVVEKIEKLCTCGC